MAAQSFPSYPCTAPQRVSRICTGIVIAAHVLVICGLLHGKSISGSVLNFVCKAVDVSLIAA
ncbi:hypothetical protein PG1C_09665 [Rugosibacter aromaticivorans]|uniref:Uncharacterized protein n=1 Tax=Rugosibacter aromaticivorans TaxID=1565605 RepID=A0A0C5J0R1_9PROT|nr:hypothetical protein PG1C_09665 [Rugosibacter aromaticivorans]